MSDNTRMPGADSKILTGKVVEQRALTEKLRSLKISTEKRLLFKAGQFTRIGLPSEDDGKDVLRAYSFVNSPDERPLEFLYDVLPENGVLTPRLAKLEPGDEVLVSPRTAGFLLLDEIPAMANLIFLSTGTGVGPFLSIMKTPQPWKRCEKVMLVHSVRKKEDLCYPDVIENFASENPDKFVYLPLVTREDCAGVPRMRITQVLASGELQSRGGFELSSATCQFMLCGNPEMVSDTTELLAGIGFARHRRRSPGNVTLEKYW